MSCSKPPYILDNNCNILKYFILLTIFKFLRTDCAKFRTQIGKFLYWYQEFLCPVEPLYLSDEKSITVEK